MIVENAKREDEWWIKPLFISEKSILGGFGPVWYRFWLDPRRGLWLVIRPHAFAHCLKRKDGIFNLQEIAVSADQRRLGLGRILLESIPGPVILKTGIENITSNEFYKSLGFLLVGRKKARSSDRLFNVWQRP